MGAYAEALELITREAKVFPDYAQKVIYSWRVTMACRLHEKDLALGLLKEAVEAGYWYDELDTDPDFQLLQTDIEFIKIVKICQARRSQAMASAVPVIKLALPDHKYSSYPVLMALHGSNGNVDVDHWGAAVQRGWLVAQPQSSQVHGPGTYTWNDWGWAQQEVCEQFSSLSKEHVIDLERIVLAGFSLGAGLAAWLSFSGVIRARGLVLVNPFLPDVTKIIPLLEKNDPHGLRVYIAAGQRDQYCFDVAQKIAELLPQYGILFKLEVFPDLEHSFPVEFEEKLPDALAYVLSA